MLLTVAGLEIPTDIEVRETGLLECRFSAKYGYCKAKDEGEESGHGGQRGYSV